MNVKIIRGKILLVKTFLSVWHERNTFTSWNKLNTMRSVIAICLDLPVLGRVDMVIGVLFSRFYPKWCTILAKLVGINQVMTVAFYDLYEPAEINESKIFIERTVYQPEVLWGPLRKAFSFPHLWRSTFLNTAREVVHRPKNDQVSFPELLLISRKFTKTETNCGGNQCPE